MRFLAAAWVGMLDDGAWLRRAGHANAMARRLADAVRPIAGVRVLFPCRGQRGLPGHVASVGLRISPT